MANTECFFGIKNLSKITLKAIQTKNIVLIENGDMLEMDEYSAKVVDRHELHKTFIDEESLGEIEYEVVRERKKLAYGGTISLVVTIDSATHRLLGEPQITLQGVAGLEPTNGFNAQARAAISEAVAEMKPSQIADKTVFKENLRIHLKALSSGNCEPNRS